MQKIATDFNKWNFNFRQIDRKGSYAIYEKILKECACPEGEKNATIGYEVIKIINQKETEFRGIKYKAKEAYPSSEQWGSYGWTFMSIDGASKKLKELIQ